MERGNRKGNEGIEGGLRRGIRKEAQKQEHEKNQDGMEENLMMNDILFEALKLVTMVSVLVIMRYVVPWLKQRIGADKLAEVEKWAWLAVLKAQQVLDGTASADKKTYVMQFLKEILTQKNLALSDEQLDALIEAAVKQMKIEENTGITVGAVYGDTTENPEE